MVSYLKIQSKVGFLLGAFDKTNGRAEEFEHKYISLFSYCSWGSVLHWAGLPFHSPSGPHVAIRTL